MAEIDRDLDRLDLILELIAHLDRRAATLDFASFVGNRDEIDLASFRLAHIGEAANKLSSDIHARNPEIDWRRIYQMRNLISHDYEGIAPRLIWDAITLHLSALRQVCERELENRPGL